MKDMADDSSSLTSRVMITYKDDTICVTTKAINYGYKYIFALLHPYKFILFPFGHSYH